MAFHSNNEREHEVQKNFIANEQNLAFSESTRENFFYSSDMNLGSQSLKS